MSQEDPATASPVGGSQRQFPCKQCGANLQFAPGTKSLQCPYCGTLNDIPESTEAVQELDLNAYFRDCCGEDQLHEQITVRCSTCGAETTLAPNVTSGRCPFCGGGIVAQGSSKKLLKPKSLLPFRITHEQAGASFKQWIGSLWFAPSELTRRAESSQITGVYIPCWTYDAGTTTYYTGQRGDDYWDTETYTVFENGRSVTRTRQVRRTRWWPVSGTVSNNFDDVLVLASRSLPQGYAQALEPWDLNDLVPYRDEYLSGFVAESYQVTLPEGFEQAKTIMAVHIRQAIEADIGGDHQRIDSVDTRYFNVTFKHALLPVWISAYRYGEKTFRFLVNARTGEVQGERPYSWIKITLAILAAIMAILIALMFARAQQAF
jgi:DNA-directed RNA polymerase subunit RPC12/RpoP